MTEIAHGVLVHESGFLQSNAVVVQGDDGVLLIDPGLNRDELVGIAADLRESGRQVVAGFSTHPHWDHLLWHADFGAAPRYGTARGAAAILARLSEPGWEGIVAGMIPPDAGDVPVDDLFGRITGLAPDARRVPWSGPDIRVIEHQAHAAGHAALWIEQFGVLVAGDMLSDVLIPMLDLRGAADPIGDYLEALQSFEDVAGDARFVVPGHGSVGVGGEVRARIDRDRAYVEAVRDGREPDDPRIGPSAPPGWEWVTGVHTSQVQGLAER